MKFKLSKNKWLKKFFLGFFVLLGISIVLYCLYLFYPFIEVKNELNDYLTESFNIKTKNLENIMNDITIDDNSSKFAKWDKFKNRNYDSVTLYSYDYLAQGIRACYLYLADEENENSNTLLKFKNINKISNFNFNNKINGQKEYNLLCYKRLTGYNYIIVSKDDEVSKSINILFNNYKNDVINTKINNYTELLLNENKKIDILLKIANILEEKS